MKENRGKLLVISAPSGTGKSTICRKLLDNNKDLALSISYTTRARRGCELHGVDYHFVEKAAFEKMVQNDDLLEWAKVHGEYYGTGKKDTFELIQSGRTVLFDIDVQGGMQIKQKEPRAILVFLLPPSIQELIRRLEQRSTENRTQISTRMKSVVRELEQARLYDHLVVNFNLDETLVWTEEILLGLREPQKNFSSLIENLIFEAKQMNL